MKTFLKVSLLLICFASAQARAGVLIGEPLAVEADTANWIALMKTKMVSLQQARVYPTDGYTECRPIKESTQLLRSTFLCGSDTRNTMNNLLLRASSFVEGAGTNLKGNIPRNNDPAYLDFKKRVGGHDLKGADLLKYYAAALAMCSQNNSLSDFCPSQPEKDLFNNFILPKAIKDPKFILIAFSISDANFASNLSHEILHAQYFSDRNFRKVVDDYWSKDLSDYSKDYVKWTLSADYDENDEYIMKNEFQAYILMTGAESGHLYQMLEYVRGPLLKKLTHKRLKPLTVK